jgi:ApaG protein
MDPRGFESASELSSSLDPGPHGSDTTTTLRTDAGAFALRIRVRPEYLPARSEPSQPMHVFGYHVAIEYRMSEEPSGPSAADGPAIRVVDRRWRIVDAHGEEEVVQGEGIVGQQPVLRPGEGFEYTSYCPLRSSWGTMEGLFGLLVLDGAGTPVTREVARIGRFYLVAP